MSLERREHGLHRLLQASSCQGAAEADQEQRDAQERPAAGQGFQAGSGRGTAPHQHQGDQAPGQAQPAGVIPGPAFRPTAQARNHRSHHLHRVEQSVRVAHQSIEATGHGHQEPKTEGAGGHAHPSALRPSGRPRTFRANCSQSPPLWRIPGRSIRVGFRLPSAS